MADMLFLMYWGTGPAYISGQAGKRYYQGSVEFLREFGVLTRHIRLPFGGFLDLFELWLEFTHRTSVVQLAFYEGP